MTVSSELKRHIDEPAKSRSRLRLAIITGVFGTRGIGGAELQLCYLAHRLRDAGHEVHVITTQNSQHTEADAQGLRLHVLPCRQLSESAWKADFYWHLWHALRRIAPQVCIVRSAPYAPAAWAFARRFGVRFIYSVTAIKDCFPPPWKDGALRALARRIAQRAIARADGIVAQTETQQRLLQRNFGTASVVIPNGHPVPAGALAKQDPPLIVWIANLRRLKRVDRFLELAGRFRDRPWQFRIYGAPHDERSYALVQAALPACPNLRYCGAIPSEEVADVLARAALLVNTSDTEGFANTYIEAWLRHTPVLVFKEDPDGIVQRFGLGYCAGDMQTLAQQLEILMSDASLRRKMGERARAFAVEHHDIEVTSRRFEAMIQAVACSERRSTSESRAESSLETK